MEFSNGGRKVKICFVEEDFLISGGNRRIIEVANRLVEKGHKVDILITLDEYGIECDWMKIKADVKRFGDRGDYDIAIMNHAPVWLAMKKVIARLKVYWWLGFEAGYFVKQPWYDAYQEPYFIIANSPFTAEMAEIVYGKKPPIVLGGIDHQQFYPMKVKKEYELLCCADEDKPEKGGFMIKRASEVLGLPLENYALKNLPQDKLAEEYSKAKIFIGMPQLEGFYFPALEAMACGVPVIVSDCGGNSCYAENEENCLVIPRHTGALVKAIKRLREDKKLQQKLIENGLKTVKQYNWNKCTNEFEKVIKEAYGNQDF